MVGSSGQRGAEEGSIFGGLMSRVESGKRLNKGSLLKTLT